jgi:hypothetical protein
MNTLYICLSLETLCALFMAFLAGYAYNEKDIKWMWGFIIYSLWIIGLIIYELHIT